MAAFEGPSRLFETFGYTKQGMLDEGMNDNNIESVMVPYGYKVSMFTRDSFKGFSFDLEGDMFLDRNQSMKCVNLSSIKRD